MVAKFLITIPSELRGKIKREARKHGITMNEYIVTVLEQFVAMQGNSNGKDVERDSS